MNRNKLVCLLMLTHGSTHAWKNLVFKKRVLTVRDLRILIEKVPGYFLISTGLTDSLPIFLPPKLKRKTSGN